MSSTEQLDHWFHHFVRSAWRLEVLDDYAGTDGGGELLEFQRTGHVAPRPPGHPWRRIIENARNRGAKIGRTRLLGHPITPYSQYELAVYEDNVAIGEDVRILDRRRLDDSWNGAPDVWLFDDQAAFRMLYGERGTWLGAEDVEPAPIARLRDAVMPLSVPVLEYTSDRFDPPIVLTFTEALAV